MIKNYFKVAFRMLRRELTYSIINTLGLAFAFTIVLFIAEYARFEMSYESRISKASSISRVTTDYLDHGTVVEQDCEVYPPLPARIVQDIPLAIASTRAYQLEDIRTIQVADKFYSEKDLYAVDASFFDLFDTPFISAKPKELFAHPFEVVITETSAEKLFRSTDVVGKLLSLPEVAQSFKIVAVVEDCPRNTHLKYNMLVSYPTMLSAFGERKDNWGGNNTYAYIELVNKSAHQEFSLALNALNEVLRSEDKIDNEKFLAQPMEDIHLHSNKSFEPEINGDVSAVYFLLVVAGLVLLIAFVNYLNLSTSKSLDRAKEIGMRKVLGSSPAQLRWQILSESILIHLIAAVVTIFLVGILLPSFRDLTDLPLSFNPLQEGVFWLEIGIILFGGAVASGILPALLISSFKPLAVLKGKVGHSKSGIRLRKGLVIVQFTVTIVLLIQTLTVREQISFLQQMDLGVDIDQVISVYGPEQDSTSKPYLSFKQELMSLPWVESVALSSAVPGSPVNELSTTTGINLADAIEETSFNYYIYQIDENYITTLDMTVMAGSNFDRNMNNDRNLIINEETARLLGANNPDELVNKKLDFWGRKWTVLGVLKNFHQTSPKTPHIPLVMLYSSKFRIANIQMNGGNTQQNVKALSQIYDKHFSGMPFNYFFMDQAFGKQFRQDEQFQKVFGVLTIFALIIACFGLFGLATFTIIKRSKEIGIRKVLGANIHQIVVLLSTEFMLLVGVSALIAIPIAYQVAGTWLDGFSERINLEWYFMLVPIILVLFISFISIGMKTLQVSMKNPVDSLKEE